MFCPNCGKPALESHRYCVSCGTALTVTRLGSRDAIRDTEAKTTVDGTSQEKQAIPLPIRHWRPVVAAAWHWICVAVLWFVLIGALAAAALPEYVGKSDGKAWFNVAIWAGLAAAYLAHRRQRSKWKYFFVAFGGALVFNVAAISFISVLNHGASRAEAELLKIPVYAALRDADPQSYAQIVDRVRDSVRDNVSRDELLTRTRPLIYAAASRLIPKASDASLVAYFRLNVSNAEILYKANSSLCYDVMFKGRPFPANTFTDEQRRREVDALAALIASARTPPNENAPNPESLLKPILYRLTIQYGKDVELLDAADLPSSEKKGRACAISIALYKQVFELPTGQAASVLRYFHEK